MVSNQIILIIIALLVPLALLKTKRLEWLLGWVCFTFAVQIFDTVPLTNLPAARVVGLLYLPFAIAQFRQWITYQPVKAWLVNFSYLLVLGIAFGFLWPWPDITLARPFTLTAPGRTVIFSVRLIIDLSLTVFIAEQALKPGMVWLASRALVFGASLGAVTALFELVTKIDLYQHITGLTPQLLTIERAHGLAGEPRGLGLVCVYSIMILLLGRQRLTRLWPILLIINLSGLLLTYSASSLILLCAGITVASITLPSRWRWLAGGLSLLTVALIIVSVNFLPQQYEHGIETVKSRLDPERKLSDIPPGTLGQEIAYRLDVFDASALLFLLDKPIFALTGTGPGLVSLPASYYVPPGIYSLIWNPSVGINGLPFHGLLLELCHSGLLGLILFWQQIAPCWWALRRLAKNTMRSLPELEEWYFATSFFLVGVVFYLIQVHSSPIWSLTLGIGWAALRKTIGPERTQGLVVEFPKQQWPTLEPQLPSS